jgi:hypothetical protein
LTITFENDNDVIVYALEKVIAYARKSQQIFVAQCLWWIASIIGLEQGLVTYIDNIQSRVNATIALEKVPSIRKTVSPIPRDNQGRYPQQIHPGRASKISREKSVSAIPRDLTEDQRLDRFLESVDKELSRIPYEIVPLAIHAE